MLGTVFCGKAAELLILQLTDAQNYFVNEQEQTELLVSNNNVSPSVSIQLTQAGSKVSIIDLAGGEVMLEAIVSDVNTTDTHRIDWFSHEAELNDL